MKSEFGKGLTYCIGLFLCHDEREFKLNNKSLEPSLWFNGAGDHLFDLEIPNRLSKELKQRLKTFQRKVLNWRLDNNVTESDKNWAIQEAKDLLREIDKFYRVETIKGDWE